MIKNKAKSIYIHIPFCSRICYYCDFTKMIPQRVDDYLDALILEMKQRIDLNTTYETIYIGGGTPSVLTIEQFKKLFTFLDNVKLVEDFEFSVEGNVESFDVKKLEYLFSKRVNRLSVGMQTLNNKLLKIINREHTKEMFIDFLQSAKEVGFEHINVDLMFALPSQSLEEVQNDLNEIKSLNLKHVSIYSLILEEKSVFYQNAHKYEFVDEELEYKMYDLVLEFLKNNDFNHYEISNFCKGDDVSKHNLVYWDAKNYIGCGLGASGYIGNCRYDNTKSIQKYIESCGNLKQITQSEEFLTLEDMKKEFILLGLRKINGINIYDYTKRFNADIFVDFGQTINQLVEIGLLDIQCDIIRLSSKGLFVANDVFEKFI